MPFAAREAGVAVRTLGRPLRQRGAVAARREPWLEKTRKALRIRSGGRCEACGRRDVPLDPAHVFGRGSKQIGEPWCSSPELMAALCRDCHNDIDRGTFGDQVMKRERLRWVAFWRLYDLGLTVQSFTQPNDPGDPLDATRALVRFCDEHGITHPSALVPALPQNQEEQP